MDIRIYNTMSRSIETFRPLKAGTVSMYQCGPTVYDTPHIGNYRTSVMNDLIRRVFEYNGYDVNQVMNITDVDDKTIRRSREEGIKLTELTQKYEKLFLQGLSSLGILVPTRVIRATDNIPEMVAIISTLLDKGIAYKADDGVYLRISDVKNYGALAKLDISHADHDHHVQHARITKDEYDKDDPRDFALWKFHVAEDGDTSWDTPFGAGRPGWHIECSAMSMKILGPTIDIHTGGVDLVFPHHTNEIAQSESATGKTFVHYWMHGGFMSMNDEKMAKSKGNIIKLEDLTNQSISPLAYRYWLLTAHYRSPINFTAEAVQAAQTALIRLIRTVGSLPDGGTVDSTYKERFQTYINDDMDIPKAVALMWELLKSSDIQDTHKRATVLDFDRVFGLKLADVPRLEPEEIPAEIQALTDAREEARLAKDWPKADALRLEIESRGYIIDDTSEGARVKSAE